MEIRQAVETDSAEIAEIYNHYVLNTIVTFEITPVGREEMAGRVREKLAKYDWLVAEIEGKVIGYAYYGQFRTRAAYEHTVESTIFLHKNYIGQGYGGKLYRPLIESAAQRGFREMIAVIALPNPGSVKLHEKMGFQEAGVLKNVGHKFGKYIDTGLWQKSLKQVH